MYRVAELSEEQQAVLEPPGIRRPEIDSATGRLTAPLDGTRITFPPTSSGLLGTVRKLNCNLEFSLSLDELQFMRLSIFYQFCTSFALASPVVLPLTWQSLCKQTASEQVHANVRNPTGSHSYQATRGGNEDG